MERTRTQVALAVVLGLLVATAGCSGVLGSTETELLLVNNDEVGHDVTVEILQDGDVVYSETATAGENSNVELATFEGAGEYTVAVTVDGETTEHTHEFGSGDDKLSIGVDDDASVTVGG